MKNKYRNPWRHATNVLGPEFYENDAPKVFEYRGVTVYAVHHMRWDYAFNGACITQRAGFSADTGREVIDGILNGQIYCSDGVVKHLTASGIQARPYPG